MSFHSVLKPVPVLSKTELEAERHGQEALLNCYCRELAGPEGHLTIGPLFGQNDWPMSVKAILQQQRGQAMHVVLPQTEDRLLTVVAFASLTGNFRYRSPVYHKSPGKPWALLEGMSLATLLLRELSLKYGVPPNTELMDQIRDSMAVATRALAVPMPDNFSDDPLEAYIDSEQSLTLGHPFHPAPKSRQGFCDDSLQRYSPEMRTRFALHYFAVSQADIRQESLLDEPCDQIVAAHAPTVDDGFAAVPVHPWQASYLLELPAVQRAIADGRVRYLGAHGDDFVPTSSIRTLFRADHPYFYKFSLNVRITNCVRKNAWYELESALQITRIMRPLLSDLQRQFVDLRVLEEPAFMSVDLRDADTEQNRQVIEGFGMILRQNVQGLLLPGTTPLLAGALFGNRIYSEARTGRLLRAIADRASASRTTIVEQWFADYVKSLLHPVLHCYFAHGLIFEPHLQNVVLGIQDGWPRQVFLRDFEGVKLVRERYRDEQFPDISERARQSLWYGNDQGWKRIAYCLFVNNFCEAITQLAPEQPALQQRLWSVVRHYLQDYQARFGDSASARRINALLTSQPFPGKANLLNRFHKRADRETTYVPVPNPMMPSEGGAAWN